VEYYYTGERQTHSEFDLTDEEKSLEGLFKNLEDCINKENSGNLTETEAQEIEGEILVYCC